MLLGWQKKKYGLFNQFSLQPRVSVVCVTGGVLGLYLVGEADSCSEELKLVLFEPRFLTNRVFGLWLIHDFVICPVSWPFLMWRWGFGTRLTLPPGFCFFFSPQPWISPSTASKSWNS